MASYFDIQVQPPSKSTADTNGALLTPQVNRILQDLNLEEHSSSDEEPSLSEDSDPSYQDAKDDRNSSQDDTLEKSQHIQLAPPPRPGARAGRQRHPHFARFHSLRSMLFSSKIEDGMAKHEEEREQAEAEARWRAEHEKRRGLNRPKTPESPNGSPTKEGFAHRMGDRLKRMTSKEVPTMKDIKEEDDNESTASSEDGDEDEPQAQQDADADAESIHNSDVEELVRWVSRKDPPSDGEVRLLSREHKTAEDSGHESLGNSDVDDLVQWVNRKEPAAPREDGVQLDYSDASTEQDSEAEARRKGSPGGKDIDELVRWISHKDGPNAGPVRSSKPKPKASPLSPEFQDSDIPELVQWVLRKDDTSGELEIPSASDEASVSKTPHPDSALDVSRGSLAHKDVDDLVRWMSRKDDDSLKPTVLEEENRGRSPTRGGAATLPHEGVDGSAKAVSRSDSNAKQEERTNDSILQEEKKQELGMTQDSGSLGPEDVDALVQWVGQKR